MRRDKKLSSAAAPIEAKDKKIAAMTARTAGVRVTLLEQTARLEETVRKMIAETHKGREA